MSKVIIKKIRASHRFLMMISAFWYIDGFIATSWHSIISKKSWIIIVIRCPATGQVVQGVPGRLRHRIFLTFRYYKGGRSSAKRTGRLYPTRNPWYSRSEAESTSGHKGLSGVPRKKSPVTPLGIHPGTVRLVVQRLNHYATPDPHYCNKPVYNWSSHNILCDTGYG